MTALLVLVLFCAGCFGLSNNTPSQLPAAQIGVPYATTLSASGGRAPYRWSIVSGPLPPGLNLNTGTGGLSGIPTLIGSFKFSIQWVDSSSPRPKAFVQSIGVNVDAPPLQITTSVLANAQVGIHNEESVNATGGVQPYQWSIASGRLPSGLSLNAANGMLSGTPSREGQFDFSVQVRDASSPKPRTAMKALTLSVLAFGLQITPGALPSGQLGVPFQATITGNGGVTPYTWAVTDALPAGMSLNASSGGIAGTPTQAGTSIFTIVLTDSVQQTAQKPSSITVAAAGVQPLAITTTTLPKPVTGQAYSATLQAAGGTPPYTWSVVSGQFPMGFGPSTTGTISGTPTAAGNFSFLVQVTDSYGATASHNFSINVESSSACGGPTSYCSRTDLDLIPLPSVIPNVGNLIGANTIVTDPDFKNRIVRVTDANTRPDMPGRNYQTGSSAEQNIWNTDSTKFVIVDSGANPIPFNFDPATMQVSRMHTSQFASSGGMLLSNNAAMPAWSFLNPNILYGTSTDGPSLVKYDFGDRGNPPTPVVIKNWSDANCLNKVGMPIQWIEDLSISKNDTRFAISFSIGAQDSAIWIGVYDANQGCSWYNTSTGEVGGDWGQKGTVNIPDRFTIHNLRLSQDGNWVKIGEGSCLSDGCKGLNYFWQVGSNNVTPCNGDSPYNCFGHTVTGFTHWISNNGPPDQRAMQIRPFSDVTAFTHLLLKYPEPRIVTGDMHPSWNNNNTTDAIPVCAHTGQISNVILRAWDWEVDCFATNGSDMVWRFAHTFATGQDSWYTNYLGNVSQDGKWFMITSDWQFKLGSTSNQPPCSAPNCRNDVFIVELK